MTFKKNIVGCVGHGFVGEAFEVGMRHAFDVLVYDPFKYKSETSIEGKEGTVHLASTIEQLASVAEIIFVCVPTPMNHDGSACTKIVDSVVSSIAELNNNNIAVIKSTVPPGTTQRLHNLFSDKGLLGVAFNPEFLTEANYINDFKNQDRIIIGCENDLVKTKIKQLYQRAYQHVPTIKTHPTIAEMVKYTTNCFLAIKVSFANEIKQISDALNIDYDKVIEYATHDKRLGESHWSVPGPMPANDGSGRLLPGYSGSCFVKDINSLMFVAKSFGIDPKVLRGGWEKNLEVRPEKDWENLKGRAVSDKEKE